MGLVYALLLLSLGPLAQPQRDYDAGMKALVAKDYRTAFEILLPLAEGGNPDAQERVAFLYFNGFGVAPSEREGAKWLLRQAQQIKKPDVAGGVLIVLMSRILKDSARDCSLTATVLAEAERGNRVAQIILATIGDARFAKELMRSEPSRNGAPCVTAVDGLKWLTRAAESGDAESQLNLAEAYDKGDYGVVDASQARSWYGKAAVQGQKTAQLELGLQYSMGRGGPADPVRAYMWLTVCCELDKVPNSSRQDRSRPALQEVMKAMNPEQIAAAKSMIAAWRTGDPLP